jgi:hypothetical protein
VLHSAGVLALLQTWIATLERLAQRLPGWAESVGANAWPLALVAALLAVALLVAGTRLGRVIPAAGAATIGWFAVGQISGVTSEWGLPGWAPQSGVAVLLGLAAGFAPPVYPLALGMVPGALLGMRFPLAGRVWLGGAVGALLLGGLALAARRIVVAATAAVAGAVLLAGSLLALAVRFKVLTAITRRPVLLTLLLALVVVAGTAFQVGARPRATAKDSK